MIQSAFFIFVTGPHFFPILKSLRPLLFSVSSQPRVQSRTYKIGVVGCGALGSYYGAKLARFGQDVHFVLRSDYDVVRRQGVQIQSPEGNFRVHPHCASSSEKVGPCDWVLIGMKTTANAALESWVRPLVGPHTAILTLQNGLGNEECLARWFPKEQILGGLCFVCLNRIRPGVIEHLAHGRVTLGEFERWPEPRTHDFASLLRNAGVPCQVTDNLARAHWEKLVWNIPFNGLGVAGVLGLRTWDRSTDLVDLPSRSGVPTDVLLSDSASESLVRGLMREVIQTAQLKGLSLDAGLEEKLIQNTRTMGSYRASTLIDFERGLPLELNALFLEPLRQAKEAGASVPLLEELCRRLQWLDPARQREQPAS